MVCRRCGVIKKTTEDYNGEEDNGKFIINSDDESWHKKILMEYPHLGTIETWHPSKNLIWHSSDNPNFFKDNIQRKKNLYQQYGWDDTNIRYSHTKIGNRCERENLGIDLSQEKGGVMYLGCSYTYGVGVNIEDTWSYRLHRELYSGRRYINFGMPGYGLEVYYRMLKIYIKQIQPDTIICSRFWNRSRTEAWDAINKTLQRVTTNIPDKNMPISVDSVKDGKIIKDIGNPHAFTRLFFFDQEPGILRGLAYVDAIKQLCLENNVHLYMFPWASHLKCDVPYVPAEEYCDFARDFLHPGRKWHKHLVDHFNYMLDNYADYDLCGTSKNNESIRLR